MRRPETRALGLACFERVIIEVIIDVGRDLPWDPWGTDSPLRVTGMMVTARVANLGRAQRAPLEMRAAGEKNASL